MKFKITSPAPAPENDVYPWVYCGMGHDFKNGSLWLTKDGCIGTCIRGYEGDVSAIGKTKSNLLSAGNTRLTRGEIDRAGLTALIPVHKVPAEEQFQTGRIPGGGNYWVNQAGTPFVVTSDGRAIALADGSSDGAVTSSVSTGGFIPTSKVALKQLPAGTKIEIEV